MSDNQDIPNRPDPLDPALARGLTQRRLSRSQLLKATGVGAAGLGLSSFLAACGVGGSNEAGSGGNGGNGNANGGTSTGTDWNAFWADQKKTGSFVFANWPLYIDTSHGKHPSLQQFKKATGIDVQYKEIIQDNASFFAKIRPSLDAGQSIGYDIIVLTNGWELTQLIDNNWLIPLPHDKLPNFKKNASPLVVDPAYDPGNKYTVAWQSGFTGIGYNPKLTKREITSVDDLFDPAFKGHVGMMSDTTELGSVGMLKLGIEPTTSTPDDWKKSAEILKQQREDGIVRQYYDQSYIKALQNGDIWITQAWSGDIFQAQQSGSPDLKFVFPKEGVMKWTDNMMLPLHAEHPLDAVMWMDFSYKPKIAAEIADWVWYVTPVPAAKEIIATDLNDPAVAKSPLVFPDPATNKIAHDYFVFENFDQYNEWQDTFNPIVQS